MILRKLAVLISFLMLSASILAGEISSSYCISNQNDFLRGGVKTDVDCIPFTNSQSDFIAFGDTVKTIAGSGTIVALGFSNRVEIYEMSDPFEPFLMHTKNIYGPAKDMVIVGNRLIIAVENGIDAIDLDTFAYTHKITYGSTRSMRFYNGNIYVGDGQGIKVIDPVTLSILQQKNTSGDVEKLEILNGVIYTFEWAGLKRFNLETLASMSTGYYNPSNVELRAYGDDLYAASGDTVIKITFNGSTVIRTTLSGDKVELRNNHTIGQYTFFPEGNGLRMSYMETVCGNGVVEGDEMCDDGNSIDYDGCTGCQNDIIIAENELCELGVCDLKIKKETINYLMEGGLTEKDVNIQIEFADGGIFEGTLQYCIENRYCYTDDSGDMFVKKAYITVAPSSSSSTLAKIWTYSKMVNVTVPISSAGSIITFPKGYQALSLTMKPDSYLSGFLYEYIGTVFANWKLSYLASPDIRPYTDMKAHNWKVEWYENEDYFVMADLPIGYQIKNFENSNSGWLGAGAEEMTLLSPFNVKNLYAEELKEAVSSDSQLTQTVKDYWIEEIDIKKQSTINGFYTFFIDGYKDQRIPFMKKHMFEEMTFLRRYNANSSFAIFKIATTGTVNTRLEYQGALPLFSAKNDEIPVEKRKGTSAWGKTEKGLFDDLLGEVPVMFMELCLTWGNNGTDDQVYVKVNDNNSNSEDGFMILSDDEEHLYSLFYLDNHKNNHEANSRDCFQISSKDLNISSIDDIEFIKVAKFNYDRDEARPELTVKDDAALLDGIELYVNSVKIFEQKNINHCLAAENDICSGHSFADPVYLVDHNTLRSNPLWAWQWDDYITGWSGEGEEEQYFEIDLTSIFAGSATAVLHYDLLEAMLEDTLGHVTTISNSFHIHTGRDKDLSLAEKSDRVEISQSSSTKADIEFGMTDKSWNPDLDVNIDADMNIALENEKYSLNIENLDIDGDGYEFFYKVFANALWAGVTAGTLGFVNFSDFFQLLWDFQWGGFNIMFDDMGGMGSISTGISTDLVSNMQFTQDGLQLTISPSFSAAQEYQLVLMTCMEREIFSYTACFEAYPHTLELIHQNAGN